MQITESVQAIDAKTALTHEVYLEAVDIIDRCSNLDELFVRFTRFLGIKVGTYHHFAGVGSFDYKKLNRYHAFNVPESLLRFYDHHSDSRDDPGVHAVFSAGRAIWLSDLVSHPHVVKMGCAKATQKTLDSVGDGLCIPLYSINNRTGYCFLGFEKPKDDFLNILPHQIQSLAQNLHVKYCSIVEDLQSYAKLTARESEVLELLCLGKSNVDIGTILNISPNTVTGYVSRIYLKLDVSDRVSAAMRAKSLTPRV